MFVFIFLYFLIFGIKDWIMGTNRHESDTEAGMETQLLVHEEGKGPVDQIEEVKKDDFSLQPLPAYKP
jgi:hypothetical protein